MAALYAVFLVFWLPMHLLSLVLTSAGAWLALAVGVFAAGRELTRLLSYPGSSSGVQREIEREYSKSVANRLASFGNSLRLWVQLASNADVVPSSMSHFRAMHAELALRATTGDIAILEEALSDLTARPLSPPPASRCSRQRSRNSVVSGNRTVGAGGSGGIGNGISSSGEDEGPRITPAAMEAAMRLLVCVRRVREDLAPLLPLVENLASCGTTFDFSLLRDVLLSPQPPSPQPAKLGHRPGSIGAPRASHSGGSGGGPLSPQPFPNGNGSVASEDGSGGGSGSGDSGNNPLAASLRALDLHNAALQLEARGLRPERAGKLPFPLSTLVAWWGSRLPFDGPAGFDLMRHEMLRRCGATQAWLTMADGTRLDCCHAAARRKSNGSGNDSGSGNGGGPAATSPFSPNCVLFCNPNAGFYESAVSAASAAGADRERDDWVSFYTQTVGCDVFLFNYRAFGRSGGHPSPQRINADALEVARYLRERRGVVRLAVHGESIGGMAAAHVARHANADLLILDRTFASLPAAAARLVGGWTKPAMALLTRWRTDVVDDYLAAGNTGIIYSSGRITSGRLRGPEELGGEEGDMGELGAGDSGERKRRERGERGGSLGFGCAKLVCCDPEDGVIAEAASLKAGVAVRLELGCRAEAGSSFVPPRAYALADGLRAPPPPGRDGGFVSAPAAGQKRFTEDQITHFCACLRHIARRAVRKPIAVPPSGAATGNNAATAAASLGGPAFDPEVGGDAGVEMVRMSGGGPLPLPAAAAAAAAAAGGCPNGCCDSDTDDGSGCDCSAREGPTEPDELETGLVDAATPLGELWIVLTRVDGLCGRPLGRAVARGFDDVRAWVCSAVVWGPRLLPLLPPDRRGGAGGSAAAAAAGMLPLQQARDLVGRLVAAHPHTLGADDSVAFVSETLEYLAYRLPVGPQPQPQGQPRAHVEVGGRIGSSGGLKGAAPHLESLPSAKAAGSGSNGGSSNGNGGGNSGGSGGGSGGGGGSGSMLCGKRQAREEEEMEEAARLCGPLLPLHCGHNNVYGPGEKQALLDFLTHEGWVRW